MEICPDFLRPLIWDYILKLREVSDRSGGLMVQPEVVQASEVNVAAETSEKIKKMLNSSVKNIQKVVLEHWREMNQNTCTYIDFFLLVYNSPFFNVIVFNCNQHVEWKACAVTVLNSCKKRHFQAHKKGLWQNSLKCDVAFILIQPRAWQLTVL